MHPNEPVEVVIRPEDLKITLPEDAFAKVDTQRSSVVFITRSSPMMIWEMSGWSTPPRKLMGEVIGPDSWTKISTLCVSTKPKKNSMHGSKSTLKWKSKKEPINAIEEERDEENNL